MKQIPILTFAMPWLASPCSGHAAVHVAGARSASAPITMPAAPGLAANGAAKLGREKSALIQARLGSAALVYGTTGTVTDRAAEFGRLVGDEQTKSTTNGGVQGPPPWRQPVIT